MISLLDEIKSNLFVLSDKDKAICEKFISERKIDALKEIVDSVVIKTNRKLKKENNLQLEEDLESLNLLKNNVDTYYKACGYDEEFYNSDELKIEDDEEYYGEY